MQLIHTTMINLTLIWYSFFVINTTMTYSRDLSKKQTLVKPLRKSQLSNEITMLRSSIVVLLISSLLSTLNRSISGYIFFDQLCINESLRFFHLFLSYSYLFLSLKVLTAWSSKVSIPTDYSATNATFFIVSPLIVLASNFYSFFFIIELLGVIILVKFTFLPLTYSSKDSNKGAISSTPRPLVISIFTYYWMSFFSSSFLLVYIVTMLFTWGTVDYFELSVMMYFSKFTMISTSSIFYSMLGLFFSFGFLLKAGAAPFHLYKVSLYKGLPIFSAVVYTFMFYLTYIIYFSFIMPVLVHTTGVVSSLFILFVLVIGTLYLLSALYSNRNLKSFLALSSSINAITIFILLISVY